MTTPLGAGAGNSWCVLGLNDGSAAIGRGLCVALKPGSTTTYLSDSIQEEILPVMLFSATNDFALGVAKYDIPAGQVGEVIVVGFARVLSSGAITAGNALEPIDADGEFDDSGGGLAGNKEVGIAIDAASGQGELVRSFVNFLGTDGMLGA